MAMAGRMVSSSMHTPTTTTRENSGASAITRSIMPGTPTHSNTTGAFGAALPSRSAVRQTWRQSTSGTLRSRSTELTARSSADVAVVRCPWSGAEANGDSCVGSTTTSAPQALASARRPGEGSLATTGSIPLALSRQITARPMGPQPMTTATSRLPIWLRRTACQPTAMGSVSTATSGDRPLGTGKASDSSTSSCSA
jgi:hypothetical protein